MLNEKTKQKLGAFIVCMLVVFSFGATGEICGAFFETTETAFGHKFPDNKPNDIRKVLKRISKETREKEPENSTKTPIAVMVVKGQTRAIVAINLDTNEKLWRLEVPVSSELKVAGGLVIFKSGLDVVAHSVLSGKKMWDYDLDEGWEYYGADVYGDIAAISIGVGGQEPGDYANGKLIALKASSGFKIWEHSDGSGLLGEPAVIGDLVFAPWDRQKLVVIDVYKGEEICRIRATNYAIHFLKRASGSLYYGSLSSKASISGIYRFNEAAATGTSEGTTVYVPSLLIPVPGEPHFGRDGFARGIGGRSTEEKIRFHFEPITSPENAIAFSDGKFYFHYWEYIIAFNAATSKVAWTHRSSSTIESVDVLASGGLLAVNTQGDIFHIDGASGEETWRISTGERVYAATFDAEGFKSGNADFSPSKPNPVVGLKKLIKDKDSRLLPIRSYATLLLSAIPRPEITRDLLDIYSDPDTPKMLRKTIVQAIEKRKVGAEYLVEALKMKYNYLEQTQSPPMKIVAPALINMNEKAAVPALLEHLMNHETRMDDLTAIIAAVHKLGDASVVETLRDFLNLYHADTSFIKNEQILASVAYTILKYGEKSSSEAFISKIRDEDQTLVELKKLLRGVLDPEAIAKEKAAAKAKIETEKREKEEAEAKAKEAAIVPISLTREEINKTVLSHQDLFKPCVTDALRKSPELKQIRMRFMLTGKTGLASDVKTLPHNIDGLNMCINKAFELIQFRKFKNNRQMATYTISIE